MSRVFAVMLGFNRPEVIRGAMENFRDTVAPDHNVVKCFFDPGYPLDDMKENQALNKQLCSTFGWTYTPIVNGGVLPNWNTVIHEHLNMVDGDFLHTFDPDVRMEKPGWLPAMVEALNYDKNAMFCASSLYFHHHDWMLQPPYSRTVETTPSGLNISRFKCLIAWASGMWRADFLITRPRHFGAKGKWYGWNEHADYERLLHHGKTWIAVTDYIDNHLGCPDQKYQEWKVKTASGEVSVSLEEYIRGNP